MHIITGNNIRETGVLDLACQSRLYVLAMACLLSFSRPPTQRSFAYLWYETVRSRSVWSALLLSSWVTWIRWHQSFSLLWRAKLKCDVAEPVVQSTGNALNLIRLLATAAYCTHCTCTHQDTVVIRFSKKQQLDYDGNTWIDRRSRRNSSRRPGKN